MKLGDLRHYLRTDGEPFVLDRSMEYEHDSFKPSGLWLSVGDDWRRWDVAEGMGWTDGPVYRVTLVEGANILHLATVADIDSFHERFHIRNVPGLSGRIEWSRVAKVYDGIVIAPYQWARRFDAHTTWYYSWDCASGCVWNLNAVASVEPMPVESSVAA